MSIRAHSTIPRVKYHLLDFPNELLHSIVSYIPLDSFVKFRDESGKEKTISQMLVLMAVCRRFRTVCYQSSLWLNDQFSISDLLPETNDENLRATNRLLFVRGLLCDDEMARLFCQRTEWTFTDMESMFIIMNRLAGVRQNARKFTLRRLDHPIFVLQDLHLCSRITDLTILCTIYPIDLDAIASCTSLKRLAILDLYNIDNYLGTLKKATLETLSIRFFCNWERRGWDSNQFRSKLVAVDSAPTITRLEVSNCARASKMTRELNPLEQSVNLTHITMLPLCSDFCDMISQATCRLTSFTVMFEAPFDILDQSLVMIAAPSLSQLEKLVIYFTSGFRPKRFETYVSGCTQILESIILHQQSVHHFELHSNVELSWIPLFARLANLKTLRWTIPLDHFYRDYSADHEKYEQWTEEQKSTIEINFDSAYASSSSVRPAVFIDFRNHCSNDEIDHKSDPIAVERLWRY